VDKFVYKRTEIATGDSKQEQESWKLWIPNDLVPHFVYRAHDAPNASHCGMGKLVEKLWRYLFWPRWVTEIRDYVRKCSVCLATKSSNTVLRPPMGKPIESQRPFQNLYVDLLGPYFRSKAGNIGFLIIVDHNTKFQFLHPLKKFTSNKICDFLQNQVFYLRSSRSNLIMVRSFVLACSKPF